MNIEYKKIELMQENKIRFSRVSLFQHGWYYDLKCDDDWLAVLPT